MTKQTTPSAKRGHMLDTKRLADTLVSGAKAYIDKTLAAFTARLEALEKCAPEKGERGEKGDSGNAGKDGIGLADIIREADGNLIAVLSDGRTKGIGNIAVKDGRDGIDGKDGADGRDGVDGRNGDDGKDGSDGKDGTSVIIDDVLPTLTKKVDEYLASVSVPQDGKDADPELVKQLVDEAVAKIPPAINGKDGRDGIDGKDGADGHDGRDGQDGIGVAGAFINKDGGLVITTSDGRTHELGAVVGKNGDQGPAGRDGTDGSAGRDGLDGKDGSAGRDGIDGKDGTDGFGFDDMSMDYDGERGFAFKFVRGDRVKEFKFTMPVVLDKGMYKDGAQYVAGDAVTFGGSMWIAKQDTTEKPGTTADWRLAVKRGRDGKDGGVEEPKKHEPVRMR